MLEYRMGLSGKVFLVTVDFECAGPVCKTVGNTCRVLNQPLIEVRDCCGVLFFALQLDGYMMPEIKQYKAIKTIISLRHDKRTQLGKQQIRLPFLCLLFFFFFHLQKQSRRGDS